MSLRILFADDSVTAQNMGKKILTEAGYEVIAVSNGAAAVKKIAEQKPDIIILDVYMPGYSGLEVCEKVRANIATIKTPVLLTVGKMEPYKPEDANRVRADGVIIKPFEASDLLAIIKKFEERIKAMPAPVVMAPPPARKVDLYPEPETPEPPARAKVMQPTVEVPDHMASSSAFSDLLSSESGYPTSQFTAPAQADETARLSALPDYDSPMSWRQDSAPEPIAMVPPSQVAAPVATAPVVEAPAQVAVSEPEPQPAAEAVSEQEDLPVTEVAMDAPPSFSDSAPVAEAPAAPVPAAVRPIQIPVYQDTAPAEFMPTAAAPTGDIEVPREPALQESAEEITRSTVADAREAGLMPTSHAEANNSSAAEAAHKSAPMNGILPVAEISVGAPESVAEAEPSPPIMDSQTAEQPVEPAPLETAQTHEPAPAESLAPAPTLTNDDFEARVAAAMAAYGQAQPASSVPAETSVGKNSLSDVPATAVPPAPFIAHEAAHTVPATQPIASVPQPVVSHMQPAPVQHVAAPVAVEPEPPQPETQTPEPQMEEPKAEPAPEVAAVPGNVAPYVAAPSTAESASVSHATAEAVAAKVEAELPAAANAVAEAAEAAGAEHHNIAQVVHRVMERMKGDLVDEIVRELRSKK